MLLRSLKSLATLYAVYQRISSIPIAHARQDDPVVTRYPVHCYDSLTTLDDNGNADANCFSVSPDGTINVVSEHKLNRKGHRGHAYPGLWDGHGHLLQYGELLRSVDLFGSRDLSDVLDRVKAYASAHPDAGTSKQWLRGVGWDQAAFGRMPDAADLEQDDKLKGKYIMLDRVDVHCIWVSEAVLALLPKPFPEIPGGEIPAEGVFCDNAMDLVIQYWPKPSKQQMTEFVRAAQSALNAVGIVGMHDAGVVPENLKLYQELSEHDNWSVRVYAMLECDKRNTFCGDEVQMIEDQSNMLTMKSVKLFADGALGSWGSAMIEPYSDKPSSTGSLLVNASTLTDLVQQWSKAGYQVNVHAIGDLANRYAIDAFESAYPLLCPDTSAKDCQDNYRFRIEHAQIIHVDDQRRMFDMGVIPSIQPTHATSDMAYAEDRLGAKRTAKEAYRMRSLLPLSPVLGSDFPVEPPNPFEGIFAAVARKSPKIGLGKGGSAVGWHPEEALSREEALRGFTLGPAHGAFLNGKAGIIKEGAFADWIVLDEPLESLSVEQLRHVKVRETWVAGRCVYKRVDLTKDDFKDEL